MPKRRVTEHAVDSIFVSRWSPRAYTGEAIDDAVLYQLFEAARWAPSAYNSQPWRFIFAKNNHPAWSSYVDFLSDYNKEWAKNASVLVVVLSKTNFTPPGKTESIQTGSQTFDVGAAWANLALQANLLGWHAHAIGGFDRQKARQTLNIPDGYQLEIVVAVGKQGAKETLPETLQVREAPTPRLPISQLVSEAKFDFSEDK